MTQNEKAICRSCKLGGVYCCDTWNCNNVKEALTQARKEGADSQKGKTKGLVEFVKELADNKCALAFIKAECEDDSTCNYCLAKKALTAYKKEPNG